MSQFRDLIARMAIDAQFARHARANPDAVAQQYGLTSDEAAQLRGLADAAAGAGPTTLGARLSKSGGTFGGVVTTLAADLDLTPDLDVKDAGPPAEEPALPAGGGDDGGEGAAAGTGRIDLSGIGPLFLDGGDAPAEGSGDAPTAEAMPRGAGDPEPGGDRTYEALGDKGSAGDGQAAAAGDRPEAETMRPGTGDGPAPGDGGSAGFLDDGPWRDSDGDGVPDFMDAQTDGHDYPEVEALGDKGSAGDEPPAAAGDRQAGSGGGGEGGGGSTGLLGNTPWGDNDGDGLANMIDNQPDNPDTSAEPFGDNDGDGQPNLYDSTPNGMPTLKPGIDLSELTQPLVPGLQDSIDIPDLVPGGPLGETPGSPSGGAEGDAPATLGEPPMPPETEPAAESPSAPTGEATGDEARAGGTGTPAGPATNDGDASEAGSGTPTSSGPDTTGDSTATASGASGGDGQQVLADDASGEDGGIGTRDVAVGVVGAAAGGIAGVVAGKALADRKPGEASAAS